MIGRTGKAAARALRSVACAFVVLLFVCSSAARAQSPEALGPPLLEPGYTQLKHSWAIVQALLDKDDWAEALVQIDRLYEVQLDHGVRNLFGPGLTIVRASDRAAEAGAAEPAVRLGRAAQRVAPDLPEARFHLARVYFQNDKLALGPVVSELTAGTARLAAFLPDRMQTETNGIAALILTLLIAAFVFAVALVARYFQLMAHDLVHVFPKGVSNIQALFFTGLLLVFPFAFGVGIVFLVLYWILATWLYMRIGERVAAVLLLVAVAALPLLSDHAVRELAYFGSVEDASYRCMNGLCGPLDLERLEDVAAAGGQDAHLALVSLGTHERRIAALDPTEIDKARALYLRAVSLQKGDPVALTALGNLSVIQAVDICKRSGEPAAEEKFQEADALYGQAIEADGGFQAALYNRSVLMRRIGDQAKADGLYRQAQAAGEEALYQFEKEVSRSVPVDRCPTTFNGNRHLIDPILPTSVIMAATLAAPLHGDRPLFVPFSGLVVGSLGHRSLQPAAAAVAVIGLVLLLFGRSLRRSRFCSYCGKVACARCRSELADLDICDACLYFRIKGSFVDPKDLWFRERRIQGNETTRRRLMRLLTFLLPGAGHLYSGRTFRGLLYLLPFCASVIGTLVFGGIVPDPVPVDQAWSWLAPAVLSGAALLLYVIALADIYSVRAAR